MFTPRTETTSDPLGNEDVKTTMLIRTIANPRRTTLAHLDDAEQVAPPPVGGLGEAELPAQTANPQRTMLVDSPGA